MTQRHEPARLVRIDGAPEIAYPEYILDEGDPQSGGCLTEGVCVIGRAETCNIVVRSDDQLISRVHVVIERHQDPRYRHYYILRDTGSINGTFINGQIMQPNESRRLMHRDGIGLDSPRPLLRFLDPDPTREHRGRLRYDELQHVFYLDDQRLSVSRQPFDLLLHLYRHMGTLCSRAECARAVWKDQYQTGDEGSRLDGVVRELRRQMNEGTDPGTDQPGRMIEARRRAGYILNPR